MVEPLLPKKGPIMQIASVRFRIRRFECPRERIWGRFSLSLNPNPKPKTRKSWMLHPSSSQRIMQDISSGGYPGFKAQGLQALQSPS